MIFTNFHLKNPSNIFEEMNYNFLLKKFNRDIKFESD